MALERVTHEMIESALLSLRGKVFKYQPCPPEPGDERFEDEDWFYNLCSSGVEPSPEERFRHLNERTGKAEQERLRNLPYDQFLASDYWKTIRNFVIPQTDYHCEGCGVYRRSLHLHHVTYEHHGEEHKYLNDLEVLCWECHAAWHGRIQR